MPCVRHASFAPHVPATTRLLLLGSLPGARSLASQQYYAHPTNQFWRLIGAVIAQPLATLPYDQRLAALADARVGLWDVIHSAERRTSRDGDIRAVKMQQLAALVATLQELRMIGFNGKMAAKIGRRQLSDTQRGMALFDLPSSSAANTMAFEAKRAMWLHMRSTLAIAHPPDSERHR